MLTGAEAQLPDRYAALAEYAARLTAQPWSITVDFGDELAAAGLDAEELQAATGVIAMFNYLTRVADASGIEFDYESPLPVFRPDRDQRPVDRPAPDSWPVVPGELRTLPLFPATTDAWRQWRGYVFDSEQPISHRERRVLARAAAWECCDRWRVDELAGYEPADDTERRLVEFAGKLSLRPWSMTPADLQALRELGYPEQALLHVISTVALQNAESRLALARGTVAR